MKPFMTVTKALSDANRVRTLMVLRGGELCLCQIIELLRLAPSTVSKHMAVLYQAGLVESRKDGRWIYYRLPGRSAAPAAREAVRWVERSLADDERIRQDAKRLRAVLKMSKAALCRRYKG